MIIPFNLLLRNEYDASSSPFLFFMLNRSLLFSIQIDKLQYLGADGSNLKWDEGFGIGTIVDGKVDDVKEVGVVVNFEMYNDVFGFITNYQCEFSLFNLLLNILDF